MTARINSNIAFGRASRNFIQVERDSEIRRSRLSSGQSINRGSEGGGRLAASEGMRAELHGLTEGSRNTEKSIDLLQSAEGGMTEISALLLKMRELAVESSNSTLNNKNREALDAEFGQLKEYIDRVAKMATYNGKSLLKGFGSQVDADLSTAVTDSATTGVSEIDLFGVDTGTYTFTDNAGDNTVTLSDGTSSQTVSFGSILVNGAVVDGTTTILNFDQLGIKVSLAGAGVKGAGGSYTDGDLDGRTIAIIDDAGGSFQLGGDAIPADTLQYDIRDMTAGGKVVDLAKASVATLDSARSAIGLVDAAIERTAKERGTVGAVLNRLEYTLDFTANAIESLRASESTIRDADFAWETSKLARNDILKQASMAAMLNSRVPLQIAMSLLTQ